MANDNTPKLPSQAKVEIGKSGTIIQSGIISAEEYNRVLIGRSALMKYDIMRRSDSTIRSTLQVCKLPILSTQWSVKPAQQPDGTITAADQEIADFLNRELFDRNINFQDFLRQALTMFDFGFSVFEKVFEQTEFNGKVRIGLKKIASRKQTTIYLWELPGAVPGITQQTVAATYYIPWDKLVVFTHDKEGDNHEGISLLRYVYRDWDIKDKLMIVNAIALEKMAVGVPIIKQDPANVNAVTSPNDDYEAEKALREFRANEKGYIKAPPGMIIEMLDMKASSTKDVQPFLNYLDSRIAKSVLAGFMEIGGSSGSGAKALAQDLTSLFMKSEEAVANVIKATITEQIIQQLCDLNYTSLPNGYPELTYGTIGDEDVTVFAGAVNQLMTAGALTADPEMEDRIREIMRLPAMTDDAKEMFKKQQDATAQQLANPPEVTTTPTSKTDTGKGTVAPKDKQNTKDTKATKQSAAVSASQEAQRKIIEVIFED